MLKPFAAPYMTAVGPETFGMHYRRSTSFDSPTVPFFDVGGGYIRLWDAGVTGLAVNPSDGVWSLDRLNATLNFAKANGQKVLYTLGSFAAYMTGGSVNNNGQGAAYNALPPTDDVQVVSHVQTLVAAVNAIMGPGQVWETWNEPQYFWLGTADRLIEVHNLMFDAIKAIDPTATVLTPNLTETNNGGILREIPAYKYADMLTKCDGVALHTYVYDLPPEAMHKMVTQMRGWLDGQGRADLDIWVTEWTWHAFKVSGVTNTGPIFGEDAFTGPGVMPQSQSAAYIARATMCMLGAGAKFMAFYGMDYWWNSMRLVTDLANPVTPTDTMTALTYLQNLILGFDRVLIGSPYSEARFISKQYQNVRSFWCADDVSTAIDTTGYSEVRDVLGQTVAKSASYTLTSSPIYCFN